MNKLGYLREVTNKASSLNLNGTDLIVFNYILLRITDKNSWKTSASEIASETGVSAVSIKRSIPKLLKLGLLVRTNKGKQGIKSEFALPIKQEVSTTKVTKTKQKEEETDMSAADFQKTYESLPKKKTNVNKSKLERFVNGTEMSARKEFVLFDLKKDKFMMIGLGFFEKFRSQKRDYSVVGYNANPHYGGDYLYINKVNISSFDRSKFATKRQD